MEKIDGRTATQSAADAVPSKPKNSRTLRLEKQTIRTLTGTELKLVGGGCLRVSCLVSCGAMSLQTR
jgi:hypothetical protein